MVLDTAIRRSDITGVGPNDVRICGYAALYDSPSSPGRDGIREILARGCFDDVVGRGPVTVKCVAHHDNALGLGDAVIWGDDIGLAFRSTAVLSSRMNYTILSAICRGDRGVSWRGSLAPPFTEGVNGEFMRVVTSVYALEHVSPVGRPTYPAPQCWLSSENTDALPSLLRDLSMAWQAGQTTMRLQADQRRLRRAS